MQHFTIYICEDRKEHSDRLSEVCASLSVDYPHTLEIFSMAQGMLDKLEEMKKQDQKAPDVVLLDIELGQMDGITLGKKIKELYPEVFLVFVTAYVEYAVKGYEANAYRYLVKPVSENVLRSLFQDILEEYKKKKKITVKTAEGEMVVNLQDLLYISAEDKYTILYTRTHHFVSDSSLKQYEEQLAGQGFFRIHRKYLVNMYYHKGIQSGKVVLTQDCMLPVSKKRMAEYQKQLYLYLGEDIV